VLRFQTRDRRGAVAGEKDAQYRISFTR
jgi:hypothetical protein